MKVSQSRKHFKNFESTVAKIIKCNNETGSHEDCHRKGRPRPLLQRIRHYKRGRMRRMTETG
jgi:hypothetical protein